MTKLPAEGRQGAAPEWPLLPGVLPPRLRDWADLIAERELELWAQAWSTPQAVAWERLRWVDEVALYLRWLVRAEMGDIEAGKEARLLSDRLGLNPQALLRLRWEIAEDEVAEQRADRGRRATAGQASSSTARRGLKAVDA